MTWSKAICRVVGEEMVNVLCKRAWAIGFIIPLLASCSSILDTPSKKSSNPSQNSTTSTAKGINLGPFTATTVTSDEIYDGTFQIKIFGESIGNYLIFNSLTNRSSEFQIQFSGEVGGPTVAYFDGGFENIQTDRTSGTNPFANLGTGSIQVSKFSMGGNFLIHIDLQFKDVAIKGTVDTSLLETYQATGPNQAFEFAKTNVENFNFTSAFFSGIDTSFLKVKALALYDRANGDGDIRQALSFNLYTGDGVVIREGGTYPFLETNNQEIGQAPNFKGGLGVGSEGVIVAGTRKFTPQKGHVTVEKLPKKKGDTGILSFRMEDGEYFIEGKVEAQQCYEDTQSAVIDLNIPEDAKSQFDRCAATWKILD